MLGPEVSLGDLDARAVALDRVLVLLEELLLDADVVVRDREDLIIIARDIERNEGMERSGKRVEMKGR